MRKTLVDRVMICGQGNNQRQYSLQLDRGGTGGSEETLTNFSGSKDEVEGKKIVLLHLQDFVRVALQ